MTEKNDHKSKWGWGRIVLVVSLALNLAVAGAVAGMAFRFGGGEHRAHGRDFAAPFIRALDHRDRAELREELRRAGKAIPDRRAQSAALYTEIGVALRADPFDAGRVAALMAERQAGLAARMTAAQDIWLRHVTAMTASERVAYADRLEDAASRGFHGRDDN
ncbi:hypothetical protein SuNHUV7_25750 (plasmid) [Pseudoseohaeicola sp. NH-UV-7]|uniref:periplasmic heavy metal sensor n=1 Tax=unclassified Sulfitobacter TaxID=196795 RepID=UPI000E0A0902|nr:periplasmic heavy metal sensor [Sulfitobacter sp. JL08]AXI55582.1 hypothetical protein C1J05_14690 [Sulfitobacter sp. JL08]